MDLGAGRRGVDMGPSALRLGRLEPALAAIGHDLDDLGNIEVPEPEELPGTGGLRFVETIAQACSQASELVSSLPPGTVPVCLGGDHSVSMGTIAGSVRRVGRLGVIWLDAHADLNTPDTSPSNNIHGMPLAHLLGRGHPSLLGIWGGGGLLRPEDVVYVGLRSIDEGERRAIKDLGIRAFTMKEIDQRGIAAVAREALEHLSGLDNVHLSFDADALDPDLAPGVGTPVPGGLTYREAHLLMELLADAGAIASVDLVEVNPFLDVRNRTASIMVEMVASLLGKRIL